MTTIWEVLLQGLTVSVVALLLLVLKRLCHDKLSPQWQYWIWSLLALRLIIPVSLTRQYLFMPFALWMETVKGSVEALLSSSYSGVYAPISVTVPLPWVTGAPSSITDWIFIVYVAGVIVALSRYLISYLRLRGLIKRGNSASEALQQQLQTVCERYGLKSCRVRTVPGLKSPFVCGCFKPILVLPEAGDIDDKVLLHELLHLKYHDGQQSVFWCFFRALHWWNPFLYYIFNQIGNDMETLCDYRVLDRLEGEERREYGIILLSMVNELYPRQPGTTSLSNGGGFIKKRIASITKFKYFSRQMAVLAICIACMLVFPMLVGMKNTVVAQNTSGTSDGWGFSMAVASARVTRCSTMAGALDTYAKGLMNNDGILILTASSLSEQEAIIEQMRRQWELNGAQTKHYDYQLDGGLNHLVRDAGYAIYNLAEQEDGSHTALLAFYCAGDDQNTDIGEVMVIPVTVTKEGGWVVRPNGERRSYPVSEHREISEYGMLIPELSKNFVAEGEYGTVRVTALEVCTVNNSIQNNIDTALGSFDTTANPHGNFDRQETRMENIYIPASRAVDSDLTSVMVSISTIDKNNAANEDFVPFFESIDTIGAYPNQYSDWIPGQAKSSHRASGSSWIRISLDEEGLGEEGLSWTSSIVYRGWTIGGISITGNGARPAGYGARIYWNDEIMETLYLKEVF